MFNDFALWYESQKHKTPNIKCFTEWCQDIVNETPEFENTDCYFGDEELAKVMGIEDALEIFSLNGLMDRGILIENVFNNKSPTSKLTIILEPNKKGVYIGTCHNGAFSVLGKMMYQDSTIFNKALEVYKILVHSTKFEEGLATAIYQSLLYDGYTIVSDSYQYKGAKNLWKRLYNDQHIWKYMVKDKRIQVGVFDISLGKFVSKDAKNLQDTDIWSDVDDKTQVSKANIRLVAST